MSVNDEIKRMMSLLESELGNVKPLLNEQGTTPVVASTSPLQNSINIGCWPEKGYTTDGVIHTLGLDYVYAFQKVAPDVRAGDKFMEVVTNDKVKLFVFERPSTDPVAISSNPKAYLAVVRTGIQASKDPKLDYLTAHGWYCKGFTATQNLTSQGVNMDQDQINQINTLVSALGVQDTGRTFSTTKPEDGKNYVKIDLATGIGTDGVSYIDKFNLADRIGPFKSQPGKFFIWASVGTQETLYDIPTEVESFLSTLGFTRTRPKPGTAEIKTETTLEALCAGQGKAYCDPAVMEYIQTDGKRRIWKMSPEQAKAAGNVSYKDIVAKQAELGKKGARQGLKDIDQQNANKPACQAAIQQLSNCERYGTDENCAEALNLAFTPDENGVDPSYAQKLDDTKKLVRTCVKNEVSLGMFSKNIKAQLSQLQGSTSPYGLRTATTQTTKSLEESVYKSIKSVITETINKTGNKKLDSIIKNNLRRYLR